MSHTGKFSMSTMDKDPPTGEGFRPVFLDPKGNKEGVSDYSNSVRKRESFPYFCRPFPTTQYGRLPRRRYTSLF